MTSDFSKLGLKDDIVKAIDEMGWTEPTPIQIEAVPVGIGGRDILAQAQTGTGKTGTYGSIILDRIEATKGGWPQALILT
ncbi:MAG: DEAD/DEAH box helicase, partial [Candidatus Methanomethylophilaceae archaeon]|nr:DEAD/DEAH box helicase [Candidatus Methanomethylophilaceae archaeon]